jgi:formamidopyrimidine-DNA glycosylase
VPELPEVDAVVRTLAPHVVGRAVHLLHLGRADILEPAGRFGSDAQAVPPEALLHRGVIARLLRRGKHMAAITHDDRALEVHLGMTGQWFITTQPPEQVLAVKHTHAVWAVAEPNATPAPAASAAAPRPLLVFRDPRRFGNLKPWASAPDMLAHWDAHLGPDALHITAEALAANLGHTKRAIKAALLDQAVLAGVGNIYADEALFRSAIHPLRPGRSLRPAEVATLAEAIRGVLAQAVAAGGSTLRDFVNGDGEPGRYSDNHEVYGRGGRPCYRCNTTLQSIVLSQRTTVFCPACQPRRGPRKEPSRATR